MDRDKLKLNLRNEWIDYDDAQYIDEAIARVEKREKNFFNTRVIEHTEELDCDDLFDDIDDVIKYLQKLKAKGYKSICQRWSGYEDNYFVAVKFEEETDDEYMDRVGQVVNKEVDYILDEIETKKKKMKEIKELEAKVAQLKKELNKK